MHIGVITPAYNVAPFLAEAVVSVLGQTHADWRMVIIDDGSHDHTVGVATGFTDPRISLISQPHSGVSVARNRGIAALDTEALLFLDADDWLAPDALAVLARTLADAPWAAAAAGPFVRVRGRTAPAPRARRPATGDLLEQMVVRNPFANGGHLLIRQEAIALAGCFRSDLHYGEDWEYWIRIALQGEFVRTRERHPLCFVRERPDSAYATMAATPRSFDPALQAIFANPDLQVRIGAPRLRLLREKAEAENAWIVGRELIRHGRLTEGRQWLRQSVAAFPSLKRWFLSGTVGWISRLPVPWRGPFRPYGNDGVCVPDPPGEADSAAAAAQATR
jgi:glycosyltransferase involved in cell wall biosynthesis